MKNSGKITFYVFNYGSYFAFGTLVLSVHDTSMDFVQELSKGGKICTYNNILFGIHFINTFKIYINIYIYIINCYLFDIKIVFNFFLN